MADSSWLMVDAWECCQSEWTRTALVLRELGKRLPEVDGREVKVMMVSRLFNLLSCPGATTGHYYSLCSSTLRQLS